MVLSVSRSTIQQVFFAVMFNVLFFLPYIGTTHFRVDQFLGAGAILMVFIWSLYRPIPVFPELGTLFKWSFGIFIWAAVEAFITPGKFIWALQFINSFSCFAGGTALFILLQRQVQKDVRVFLLVSLLASILLNGLAAYMWLHDDSDFSAKIIANYGGATDASYGELGTLGAISFYGGRIPSLFPHTQAFGVYDLLILAVASYTIYLARGWVGRTICICAVFMSFVGGILSGSKTYAFCLILVVVFYGIIALPGFLKRPRLNFYYLALVILPVLVAVYFYNENRFLRDEIDVLAHLDWDGTMGTRIGSEGYLVKSGTIRAMLQPSSLLFGMGGWVSNYAWADNGFFQVLMFGGIFFFGVFYSYLAFLITRFLRHFEDRSSQLFLALYLALVCGNVGTLLFLFPRTGLLLTFFTLVALYDRALRAPPAVAT